MKKTSQRAFIAQLVLGLALIVAGAHSLESQAAPAQVSPTETAAIQAALLPAAPSFPAKLETLLPAGFQRQGPPRLYGTVERPLQDGTIFDYIDGGGVAYLDHGCREVFHAEFTDGRGTEFLLDVFAFSSPDGARRAYADEKICPEGGSPLDWPAPAKAYRFPPDYFVYFVQGMNLVYVHTSDDRQAEALDRFASAVRSILSEEPKNR